MLPPAVVGYGYAAVPPVLPGWIDAPHRQPGDSPMAWHAGLLEAIYLIGAMIGGSSGLLTPALSQLAARSTQVQVGSWVGWQSSAGNIGQAMGSALGGLLFGVIAAGAFAAIGLLLGTIAAVTAAQAVRRKHHRVLQVEER